MEDIYHWYHVYADGQWERMVDEHIFALRKYGLYDALTTLFVGFVGSPENVAKAKKHLTDNGIEFVTCAEAQYGWEQVTQAHMWEFSKDHDGACVYAHTKGASHAYDHFSTMWRMGMTWYTICKWKTASDLLKCGIRVAGPHWMPINHTGGEHHHNHRYPASGIFAGTFWWTTLEEIRNGDTPDLDNRYCAEHWISQRNPALSMDQVVSLGGQSTYIGSYTPEAVSWYTPPL